jgi:hypothetical protein
VSNKFIYFGLVCFCFEMGSSYQAQADLQLTVIFDSASKVL